MNTPGQKSGATVEELLAQVETLRLALEKSRAEPKLDPQPLVPDPGVTVHRDADLGWVVVLGDIPDTEANLVGEMVVKIQRVRAARKRSGLPGASFLRVDETDRAETAPDVHAWMEGREARKRDRKTA